MSNPIPGQALDEGSDNPDSLVGEPVDPEHDLDVSNFAELDTPDVTYDGTDVTE